MVTEIVMEGSVVIHPGRVIRRSKRPLAQSLDPIQCLSLPRMKQERGPLETTLPELTLPAEVQQVVDFIDENDAVTVAGAAEHPFDHGTLVLPLRPQRGFDVGKPKSAESGSGQVLKLIKRQLPSVLQQQVASLLHGAG